MTTNASAGSSESVLSVMHACILGMKRVKVTRDKGKRARKMFVAASEKLLVYLSSTVLEAASCDEWIVGDTEDWESDDDDSSVPTAHWLDCAFALLGFALEIHRGSPSEEGVDALDFAIGENYPTARRSNLRTLMADPADFNTPPIEMLQALAINLLAFPEDSAGNSTPAVLRDAHFLYLHRLIVAIVTLLKWEAGILDDDVLDAYRDRN